MLPGLGPSRHRRAASSSRRGKGGSSEHHDETPAFDTDFDAPPSRKVAIPATRFVHPHSWSQPAKIPTFPHQKAKKSPFQQHVVSYNPITLL